MKFDGATYRPLAAKQTQPQMQSHDIVCLHTMVGNLSSTDAMFHENGWGGTESHFGVGGKWGPDAGKGWDGKIFQWQDTAFTADANLNGNHHVISIETADNAPKTAEQILPWTAAQLDSIVAIVAWACETYDIPATLVPDSKPGRRGIAYHRQGILHSDGLGSHPGWLVAGGEHWSTSTGKGCPGPTRIAQLQSVVIPRVQMKLLTGVDMTKQELIDGVVSAMTPVIRATVLDVLTTEKIVPNLASTDDVVRPNMSMARAASLGDQKNDLELDGIRTIAAILGRAFPSSTS
jgi:hypothetical protein